VLVDIKLFGLPDFVALEGLAFDFLRLLDSGLVVLLPTGQMAVPETESAIIELESDNNAAFVPKATLKPTLDVLKVDVCDLLGILSLYE
jgi:hypothetical protein